MNFIERYQPDTSWVNELDRFFDRSLWNPDIFQAPREAFYESDDAWILRLDLPGFVREDIQLSMADGFLKLNAETPEDRPFGGKFERQWKLGNSLDATKIGAHLENGVLEVRLAKKAPADSQPIAIDVR
jgi:HSP20 family protein